VPPLSSTSLKNNKVFSAGSSCGSWTGFLESSRPFQEEKSSSSAVEYLDPQEGKAARKDGVPMSPATEQRLLPCRPFI
jgi:hypothetical protein